MRTNDEERHKVFFQALHVCRVISKGPTINFRRAGFDINRRNFAIFDCPVIAARKGEFEDAYEENWKTSEHVQLAETLGASKLVIVVNKMDDPTVNWSNGRYDEIVLKMTPFLKASGYDVDKDIQFLPMSGLDGSNMKTRLDGSVYSWWNGACLFDALDAVAVPYPKSRPRHGNNPNVSLSKFLTP